MSGYTGTTEEEWDGMAGNARLLDRETLKAVCRLFLSKLNVAVEVCLFILQAHEKTWI